MSSKRKAKRSSKRGLGKKIRCLCRSVSPASAARSAAAVACDALTHCDVWMFSAHRVVRGLGQRKCWNPSARVRVPGALASCRSPLWSEVSAVKTMARLGLLGAILLVSPLRSPGQGLWGHSACVCETRMQVLPAILQHARFPTAVLLAFQRMKKRTSRSNCFRCLPCFLVERRAEASFGYW